MAFRTDPDLALGPLRPRTQPLHFRMVRTHAVQDGQLVRVEHAGLRAEVAQQPLRFQRQLATEGLRAQRAVQDQDARCMPGAGQAELVVAGNVDRGRGEIGQVE